MAEAPAPADPASPWMTCLERAHALTLTAARRIEEEVEPSAHLGPAARKIEGGLVAMYDAFDGRADRTTSIGVAHARLFDAAILVTRAGLTGALEALESACGELIAAEARFPRVPIAGRATIALQAGVDLPPFHTLDRTSLAPSLRAPPEPETSEPEIALPELPDPKTFAELSAAAAAMKQIAKDRAEARKKRKLAPKKIAPPPEEVPRGFAHAPPRTMPEDEFVRRWARECIDEVGMLGVQRTPLLGDDWRSSHPLEKRLVAAIDAIAALGPRAVAHVEPYVLDAPAADPMRIFAVTMIGGCLEGRDAIACAERVLHHFGPGDPAVAEPFISAMKLAENPFAPNVLRSLLASSDRACRRIGAEVLAHRGIATERELVDMTEDGDPELFAIALPAIAASRSREVHRAIATGLAHADPRVVGAALDAMALAAHPDAGVAARAAAAGPLGDAALMRLAIVADDQEARWLLERLHARPTEAAIEASGWAGLVDAVPALIRLLESGEDDQKLAAGEALYRLLGAQILEMVEIAPDDLDTTDVADPDPEGRPPRVSLAEQVSDPRDRPPQGQPEKIEVPSYDPDRWRAYWNEQGSRIDAKQRIRRGQAYAPSISLYELDRVPLTPRERRCLHRELCARTGKITPFDPHDFVAAQESRLKVWEGIVRSTLSAPGAWARPSGV